MAEPRRGRASPTSATTGSARASAAHREFRGLRHRERLRPAVLPRILHEPAGEPPENPGGSDPTPGDPRRPRPPAAVHHGPAEERDDVPAPADVRGPVGPGHALLGGAGAVAPADAPDLPERPPDRAGRAAAVAALPPLAPAGHGPRVRGREPRGGQQPLRPPVRRRDARLHVRRARLCPLARPPAARPGLRL